MIQRLTLAKLFRIAISVLQTNISFNGSTVRAEASIAREERYVVCKVKHFVHFFYQDYQGLCWNWGSDLIAIKPELWLEWTPMSQVCLEAWEAAVQFFTSKDPGWCCRKSRKKKFGVFSSMWTLALRTYRTQNGFVDKSILNINSIISICTNDVCETIDVRLRHAPMFKKKASFLTRKNAMGWRGASPASCGFNHGL